jgi:hypothetical protein
MQLAGALAAAEHRELLPFKGMPPAHDAHLRRKVFEMGSVSSLPSTPSITTGCCDSSSTESVTSGSCA